MTLNHYLAVAYEYFIELNLNADVRLNRRNFGAIKQAFMGAVCQVINNLDFAP